MWHYGGAEPKVDFAEERKKGFAEEIKKGFAEKIKKGCGEKKDAEEIKKGGRIPSSSPLFLSSRIDHSASVSRASSRKLTGRNPSLQEIIADFLFFIQPS